LGSEQAPQRNSWVEKQTLQILSGHTDQVIAHLRTLAQQSKRTKAQGKALETAANYFQRNLAFMRYHDYLAHGWPIASGVIEGACRHFGQDRCELSGMRWSHNGVENLHFEQAVQHRCSQRQSHQQPLAA
jgi:hypothetical protein